MRKWVICSQTKHFNIVNLTNYTTFLNCFITANDVKVMFLPQSFCAFNCMIRQHLSEGKTLSWQPNWCCSNASDKTNLDSWCMFLQLSFKKLVFNKNLKKKIQPSAGRKKTKSNKCMHHQNPPSQTAQIKKYPTSLSITIPH